MATYEQALRALPGFRNDLLRRRQLESSSADSSFGFSAQGAFGAMATPLTNVHATGVGLRSRGGIYDPTDNVIKVFVFEKVDTTSDAIPKSDDAGVGIDVEYMPIQVVRAKKKAPSATRRRARPAGAQRAAATAAVPEAATAQAAAATPQRDHRRPVQAGVSISPLDANFVGTLGCFLLRRQVDAEELFVLSNNHVLANVDQLPVGTRIVQPGPEVPPFLTRPDDVFARLHTAIPLQFPGGPDRPPVLNQFDAAIASVTDGTLIERGRMFGIPQYDPSKVLPAVPGMRVMKMGRTTGLTRGTIVATAIQGTQVNYGTLQFPRIAVFQNTIRITGDNNTPFSLPGDSGSVILDEATGHPVALLFAGDGTRTTACDLGPLCQHFAAWPV
jgi:hypothetical protein